MENAKSKANSTYPQEKIIFPSFQKKDHPEFSWRHWIIASIALLVLSAGIFAQRHGGRSLNQKREERRIRSELTAGRVLENAPFLGQVVAIAPDYITARVRVSGLSERDLAIYAQPGAKFYFHFRDPSRAPSEGARSEIKVGQFIAVESDEPLGEGRAVYAKSINIIE